MPTRALSVLGVVAVVGLLAGCNGLPGSNSSSSAGQPIKIGLLLEQTGSFSWYGQENLEGAQLYVDKINSSGGINGRQIELDTVNNESTPDKSVSGARKLMQDGVVAILGLGLVGDAQAVSPLVQDSGPPVYSTSGAYLPDNRMMFAGTVYVADTQKRALQFLIERKMTNIALLLTNDASGQVAQQAITQAAPGLGIQITRTELFNPDDVDVTPQMTQIRASNPQAIVAWVVGKPLGVVLKASKQLGVDVPIITSHGNLTPGFIESIADVQTGPVYMFGTKDLIWRDLPDGDPQKPLVSEMQNAMQSKYQKEGGIGTGTAYDGLMLLATALKQANSTDPNKLADALESLRDVNGVIGTYNLSQQDHRGLDSASAIPMEIVSGKLQAIK